MLTRYSKFGLLFFLRAPDRPDFGRTNPYDGHNWAANFFMLKAMA
jgi:hypothetical protein